MIKNHYHKLVVKIIKILLIFIILIIFFWFLINSYIVWFSRDKIFSINNLESKQAIALVLWAGIKYNKAPTDILKDRLETVYEAYKKWKILKIIVSWDNAKVYHNEPKVMKDYLLKLWVKKEDIYPDYAWFDTYDSIYRAKNIFWVKKIVIFTQKYHLYRSIFIANKLWINSIWVISNRHNYLNITKFTIREFFSRIKAFLEVEFLRPKSRFLWKKIQIK